MTKLKVASHSEMLKFGSDIDGFTVKKKTQEIRNSRNKYDNYI